MTIVINEYKIEKQRTDKISTTLENSNSEIFQKIREIRKAMNEIKTLSGLLPI